VKHLVMNDESMNPIEQKPLIHHHHEHYDPGKHRPRTDEKHAMRVQEIFGSIEPRQPGPIQ
jgi:hypothetical protein